MIAIFRKRDRLLLGLLVLAGTGTSFLDVIGIGLLYPYISVLQDPNKIFSVTYVSEAYRVLGFESTRTFLYLASGGLIGLFCVKAALGILMNRWQVSFVFAKQAELSSELLDYYLSRPYSFFQAVNSATLIGNVTTAVNQVCSGVIRASITLLSELVVLLGLLGFLIVVSPGVFLAVVALVGGISGVIFMLIKKRVARYGEEGDKNWKGMIKTANEALGAAKEIQVLGCARFFVELFRSGARGFVDAAARNAIVGYLPRTMLETGAVVSLVLISVSAVAMGQSGDSLFAILAVFAVATIRMVPSANRILLAWNGINYHSAVVRIVSAAISDARGAGAVPPKTEAEDFALRTALSVHIKEFRYKDNPHFCLRNVDLEIRRGQSVAIIGHSGSGKSTLIDLILGLYPDYAGAILVDGREIREDTRGWQKTIGYIPQSLYVRDDTIARNVAFGVPDELIDFEQVERAIRLAGLQNVVESQAEGLETVVGERGIRLSGGERQRIGIARALYHDPDLLILDEATSALDNVTERQIVDSILALSPAKTIIVIAHRLSSVRRCDTLYLMRRGEIVDRGDFDGLRSKHPDFMKFEDAA